MLGQDTSFRLGKWERIAPDWRGTRASERILNEIDFVNSSITDQDKNDAEETQEEKIRSAKKAKKHQNSGYPRVLLHETFVSISPLESPAIRSDVQGHYWPLLTVYRAWVDTNSSLPRPMACNNNCACLIVGASQNICLASSAFLTDTLVDWYWECVPSFSSLPHRASAMWIGAARCH